MHPFDSDARSIRGTALEDSPLLSGHYWGELRTFLALAKAKSLNRAADDLGVSHMTVGRQIRRLQDIMDTQLVVLTKAGARLTPKGEQLARALTAFDRDLYTLAHNVMGENKLTEGMVRVSITDGLGLAFVTPALRRFSMEYPRIQIELKTPMNFMSLRENRTDLMIGFSPDEASGDISCKQLGYLHLVPVASPSYIERKGMPTPGNLSGHEFIDSEQYSARGGTWRGWRELVQQGRVAHSCDASITYGIMVKAGLGIGLLGNYTLLEPQAQAIDLGVVVSLPLYSLALSERLESKPVRIAHDFVAALFSPRNPWFAPTPRLTVEDEAYNDGIRFVFNL
jgi:DNA-binding transcriptional LysR family regulator